MYSLAGGLRSSERHYVDPDGLGQGNRGHGRGCCGARHRRGGAGRGALAEPAVVAALLGSAGHGYDLRRAIAEMTGEQVDVDQGGLYRVLRRLEDEGFVASSWTEGDSGPQRREYSLMPEAQELARDWVDHLRERERLAGMLAELLEKALEDAGTDDEDAKSKEPDAEKEPAGE